MLPVALATSAGGPVDESFYRLQRNVPFAQRAPMTVTDSKYLSPRRQSLNLLLGWSKTEREGDKITAADILMYNATQPEGGAALKASKKTEPNDRGELSITEQLRSFRPLSPLRAARTTPF